SPHLLLCGDFNCDHPLVSSSPHSSTAAVTSANSVESQLFSELEALDFICASADMAHGIPTHRNGGVLDLFFEYDPTARRSATPPVISDIRVDILGCTGFNLTAIPSDHIPVEAILDFTASFP